MAPMYNVTLISTKHSDLGACSFSALYRILQQIKPEVIFQEIPSTALNRRYVVQTSSSLETDAVRLYAEDHDPIIVAVDLDEIPDRQFFDEYRRAFESVERLRNENGLNLRTAADYNHKCTAMYGFSYLNSEQCIYYNNVISEAVDNGLKVINDDRLNAARKAWVEIIEKREIEMLENIYAYTNEYSYDRAVFLVGASHRKSLMDKIQQYSGNDIPQVNWAFYLDPAFEKLLEEKDMTDKNSVITPYNH